MTLDEAIKHCEEVVKEKQLKAHDFKQCKDYGNPKSTITSGVVKCEACADEHRQLAEWLKELKAYKEQEPCEDAISRKAALEAILTSVPDFCCDEGGNLIGRNETASYIRNLPSVTPKQKTGEWIYDKSIENWRCSECKETPKTMGYCGSVNFMAEHFKFCNHCGTKMEDKE